MFESKKNAEVCILENEVLVYGDSSDPSVPKLISLDLTNTSRKQALDVKLFGIESILKFLCFGDNNQFLILSSKKAKSPAEVDTNEVYTFSGGQFFNAYKVLNQKVRGVDKNLDKIQAYIHQGSTIVYVSSSKSDAVGAFYRVYSNNPLLFTEVETG